MACADIFNIRNAEVDAATGDGGADVKLDVPYDYVVFDAVDFDVNTAICEGGVPIVDAGDAVWVSASTGADNGQCGAQGAPCKSIAQALANRAGRNVIYLDNSTFFEVVNLQSAVTIQGGWVQDAGWNPSCDNTRSVIEGPADGGPAAIEVNANGVTLRLLTVRSKQQGAQGTGVPVPESVYAVRATDSPNLVLDNVTLIAQNAGGGAPGTTPTGSITCAQVSGDAGNGGIGSGGLAGTFSATGFNVTTGGSGTQGSTGVYTPPGAGQCNNNCNRGCP